MNATPWNVTGHRFGPYQIVREVGRGGMGAVYLAERADDEFKQQVALKILRGEFSPEDVLRRFRDERQILATLSHPNICRLLDGGSTPSGEPYLVMDYIDGVPMDQFCDNHNYTIRQRVELFRQVCAAVQYVHANLIVHRDLKPSNILVTTQGVVKLLDFGIAKILKPDLLDVTRTDTRAMTLAYASPEQIRGEPVTTASDVYALGVILYELLTGQRPYRLKSSSALELPRAIMEDEPEKPSVAITRDQTTASEVSGKRATIPERLQHHLKGDIDNILLKALRKEPERRYSSAELFSEDLRRHLENLPVTAHQDSFGYRATKFVQRHKVPVIAAAFAVISLIGGLITTIVEANVARRERALAESRFQDVRKLATTFLFDVHDAIQNLPGATPARALIAKTGTEYLDRLAREAQNDASLQEELANGYLKMGDVQGDPYNANLGDSAKAVEDYRKALALAQAVVARNPQDAKAQKVLAMAHYRIGGVLPFANKTTEALDHSNEALKIYQQFLARDPGNVEAKLDVARVYEQLGDLLGGAQTINLGRRKEAGVEYQKALNLIPDLPKHHALFSRATRGKLVLIIKSASIESASESRVEALDRIRQAAGKAEEAARTNPSDRKLQEIVPYALNKLAGLEQSFGDFKGSLSDYHKAVAIDERLLSADPNNSYARQGVAGRYKNIGDLYFYSIHDFAESLNAYRHAGELMDLECRLDPNNFSNRQRYAEVLTCIGSCLLRLNQPEEARRQSKLGLDMARELADRPNSTRDHKYNYAWLAVTVEPTDMQEPKRALPYIKKAVEMDGGTNEYTLLVLAQTYEGLDDFANCVDAAQKALALFPNDPGAKKSGMMRTVANVIGECQEGLKKQPK